jgi:hypothetical protein
MAIELAHRYEQISAKAYEHPADRAATSALHSVPLLDTVIKRLTDLGHERRLRQIFMGNAVRIGTNQVPDVWGRYLQCTSILDLASVPDLYMINDPTVNAMAIGAKTPLVVVNSSLIGSYSTDDVQTVLAHEVAHVLSEHYYYTTALLLLKQFMEGALPRSLLLGLPVRGMYLALLEWSRAAELSADRAAAIVMDDPLAPCRVLMRLAGGSVPGMNLDAFLAQAAAYDAEDDLFSRHSDSGSNSASRIRSPCAGSRSSPSGCSRGNTTVSAPATTRAVAMNLHPRRNSRRPWPTTGSDSRDSSIAPPATCKTWGSN